MLFDYNNFLIFMMAVCRMTGSVFFNPIFGRQSVPATAKVGLSIAFAYFAAGLIDGVYLEDMATFEFVFALVKEFAIGFALGYIMRLFLAIFSVSGYVIDMQIGYSMATMYDASSNAQISVTGNLMTLMYSMLFFVTNSHANLVALIVQSYEVLPIGFEWFGQGVGVYMIQLFGHMLFYALQLAIPFIILELITEVAVGMLMKMVPNINVFVINLHLKMMVGLIVILTVMPTLTNFMSRINAIMFERMQEALTYFLI